MGLFEKIFPLAQKKQIKETVKFQLLNGYSPIMYGKFSKGYEQELIRLSIDARARHISKLKIEVNGSGKPKLQTRLRHAPNNFQTWSQFLYRTSTILDNENNVCIVPVYGDYGDVNGIYSIAASQTEIVEYQGEPYLRLRFSNGKMAACAFKECGIMTKFQYKNDFFGENNSALNSVIELLDMSTKGIKEGVKKSSSFQFMATLGNWSADGDLEEESTRFAETSMSGGKGILLFPNTYKDIKQIDSKQFVPDSATIKNIEENVFSYFGVNREIIQNKAFGDSWSAFYEGAIEPFAIQFSEVVTNMLFSEKERSSGNIVIATSNRLQYMTTESKLKVSAQLSDRGILNRDEVREIWNLPPLPNGEGQTYIIRGEYYNASDKLEEGERTNED